MASHPYCMLGRDAAVINRILRFAAQVLKPLGDLQLRGDEAHALPRRSLQGRYGLSATAMAGPRLRSKVQPSKVMEPARAGSGALGVAMAAPVSSPIDLQCSKRNDSGVERGPLPRQISYPFPRLFRVTQLRITQLTSFSPGSLGSKSMPAWGAVPAVSRRVQFSMSRSSAVMTLMPWQ